MLISQNVKNLELSRTTCPTLSRPSKFYMIEYYEIFKMAFSKILDLLHGLYHIAYMGMPLKSPKWPEPSPTSWIYDQSFHHISCHQHRRVANIEVNLTSERAEAVNNLSLFWVKCICTVSVFDPSGASIIVFIIMLMKKILIIEKYMNGI